MVLFAIIILINIVGVIIIRIVFMTMMGNGVYLFDGGDLSKSLFRLVLIALDEDSDGPLHSLAHAMVVALLPARQKQQSRQQPSSTHQVNLRHAAVALQALNN